MHEVFFLLLLCLLALPTLSPILLDVGVSEHLSEYLIAGQHQPTTLIYIYMSSTNSIRDEPSG